MWWRMLQKSFKQLKIVDRTGLYGLLYLKKAGNCAFNDVSQFNLSNTWKSKLFEFGSKLQNFLSITCLIAHSWLQDVHTTWILIVSKLWIAKHPRCASFDRVATILQTLDTHMYIHQEWFWNVLKQSSSEKTCFESSESLKVLVIGWTKQYHFPHLSILKYGQDN